jgi:rhodanese-related sulfurtransferase
MNAWSHNPTAVPITYAGDVTPAEAWEALQENASACMIDVRTEAEWKNGAPDLSALDRHIYFLSLKFAPDYTPNPHFIRDVVAAIPDQTTPIYLLCKVGGRSAAAAMQLAELGYTQCYNIIGGFEGSGDVPGWKAAQLPWGTN